MRRDVQTLPDLHLDVAGLVLDVEALNGPVHEGHDRGEQGDAEVLETIAIRVRESSRHIMRVRNA